MFLNSDGLGYVEVARKHGLHAHTEKNCIPFDDKTLTCEKTKTFTVESEGKLSSYFRSELETCELSTKDQFMQTVNDLVTPSNLDTKSGINEMKEMVGARDNLQYHTCYKHISSTRGAIPVTVYRAVDADGKFYGSIGVSGRNEVLSHALFTPIVPSE